MKSMRVLLLATVALFSRGSCRRWPNLPRNWPQWRGPNRDGISKETGLLKQWPAEGPPLAWKAAGAGRGYSSFSISNGKLYTMGLRGDREFVVAFDVATGKEAWATAHGGAFRTIVVMAHEARRRSTAIVFMRSAATAIFRHLKHAPARSFGPRTC